MDWSSKDDGTKTAVYAVSKQNGNYTWRLTDTEEEYVTRGGWLNSLSSSTSMSFDFSSGNTDKLSHDFTKLGTQTIKRDEADLQVFVSPTGAKALGSGTERIRAYRMWELINSDAGNIMVEPDFVWNKLSGPADISFVDDAAEITGNQVDSGNARHNWADISANGGTSIFAVRYDAMDMDTGNNKSHAGYYPATNPDRVAFVVVADELGSAVANVPFNGDFAANARLDGWDYIYDTWYYLRSGGVRLRPDRWQDHGEHRVRFLLPHGGGRHLFHPPAGHERFRQQLRRHRHHPHDGLCRQVQLPAGQGGRDQCACGEYLLSRRARDARLYRACHL